MTIPVSSNYPVSLDTDQNLYEVQDSLRVRLVEDYNPGDKTIVVFGNASTMNLFPDTGIITLTEQCNEPELRAISFYYGSKTLTTFEELELLPGFTDVAKPKIYTDVTQNVMDVHHNALKDAIVAIEKFAGKKGEAPLRPMQGTMEQRITYLRNLALAPKAWFGVDKTIGLAPFTVEFDDQSFRLGDDGTSINVEHLWDFGDNTGPSIITINETTEVPSNITNVLVKDTNGGKIKKTYTKPGIYSVSLKVTNDFSSDTVTFPDLITARFQAPDYAVVEFVQRAGQIVTLGTPPSGPYTTPPKIRAASNNIIDVIINPGINTNTGRTYGGEAVDGTNTPIDPIKTYTWSFADDLTHNNAASARAVFSIGGLYDLNLRVDTNFGSYRITSYKNSFDIVEQINLWLWTYNDPTLSSVSAAEFGLISETFKSTSSSVLTLGTDESFLTGQVNADQQLREFRRNNGFAQRGSTSSGNGGVGVLYWASGRNPAQSPTIEAINMSEFNGFVGTYTAKPSLPRPWNWIGMASNNALYFVLGGTTGAIAPNTSPTNQTLSSMSLNDLVISSINLGPTNYKNGADELIENEVSYDVLGNSQEGNMSVYRSCWHDNNNTGYFLRNQGVGDFFRIRSFYKTTGNIAQPFQNIQKLPDIIGDAKLEGQLVSLSQGVYFFSNSGSVAAYSPITGVWQTGGPGVNSAAFRLLQDTSIVGFDDSSQTLLATSDGDNVAYLSFDYSQKAFIKFNQTDTTFSGVSSRPTGKQWQICIF